MVSGYENIEIESLDRKIKSKVVSGKSDADMCILESQSDLDLFFTSIRDINSLDVGERVYAVGNPSGLEKSFGDGLISGIRGKAGTELIQTTALISPGSSGGALIDEKGNLIGITSFYLQSAHGIGFAIPVSRFCSK